MGNIEVEVRGPLEEDLDELEKYLENSGENIRDFRENTIFYHGNEKYNFPIGALRLKKDNKGEKLIFKNFDGNSQEINEELEISIEENKMNDMIEILDSIGVTHGDIVSCKRKDFKINDMRISIKVDHVLGPHFELEKSVGNEDEVEDARKELVEFSKKVGLSIWEDDDYKEHRDRCLSEIESPQNVRRNFNV